MVSVGMGIMVSGWRGTGRRLGWDGKIPPLFLLELEVYARVSRKEAGGVRIRANFLCSVID